MTIDEFITRWKDARGGAERANYQMFLSELCEALDLPRPDPASADFQGEYDRQLEKAQGDVARGGVDGTLLAFGSQDSAKSADLAVASFAQAQPGAMKGVRVMFIGALADRDRVKAAVEPSGAKFEFIEAK